MSLRKLRHRILPLFQSMVSWPEGMGSGYMDEVNWRRWLCLDGVDRLGRVGLAYPRWLISLANRGL